MPYPFRYSICNEVYGDTPFHVACRSIREIGYDGIEIAPFTLAEYPAAITPTQRKQYRGIMNSEGLHFAGLHWLMVAPKGLHVTTADDQLRARSWAHIRDLVDLCADLGEGGVMVFGSPKQRSTIDGGSVAEATKRFEDGLAGVSSHAMQRGVAILVEALPGSQSDVVRTLDEAVRIVQQIASPAVRTMFDTHNAEDETESHAALVDKYFESIRHVHVNEMDGRHPGTGRYDFAAILETLARRRYTGWVSLEVFDFAPGAETIGESLTYLKEIAKGIEG
jgi:sugar phosphate isomerase/epimerase